MQNILKNIITATIMCVVFFCIIYFTDSYMTDKSYYALYSEIKQATEHCYAVEGRYPPDFDYIKKHYGIKINNRAFTVDYRRVSPTREPEIKIKINKKGAFA